MANDATPPAGAAPDWSIPQDWKSYTAQEHATWDRLFARQAAMLPERVVPAFIDGLDVLRMDRPGIPDFAELNERLVRASGWRVIAVPGLVPDALFFEHLANRRFVAGRFIRRPEQIDYLQEPDIFHDVFGHVPLLAHPVFAEYMQAYGEGGLRAARCGMLEELARLYWYTVEFGLIRQADGLRLYGAGIVSSFGESRFALDDPSPHRIAFNLDRVMRTRYRIDDYQQTYFVIDSFEDLLRQTRDADFGPVYARLRGLPPIEPGALLATDEVVHMGPRPRAPALAPAIPKGPCP
ncbi:MAG TPA: phenylalanine 4-monooxygenase [Novosphingobium sp.]